MAKKSVPEYIPPEWAQKYRDALSAHFQIVLADSGDPEDAMSIFRIDR
jgi:hypothetical protein